VQEAPTAEQMEADTGGAAEDLGVVEEQLAEGETAAPAEAAPAE
jgi:hypothetical protein